MEYCRDMSISTNLDSGSISAKVSNYKSVAGINAMSNASRNTIEIFNKYGDLTLLELECKIK